MNGMIMELTLLMILLSLPMQAFLTGQLTSLTTIEPFTQDSSPFLPENVDVTVATALDFFNLLFKSEIFSDIKDHTYNYCVFKKRFREMEIILTMLIVCGRKAQPNPLPQFILY